MLAVLRRRPLLAILSLALALRIAVAVGVHIHLANKGRDFLIAGDAEGYWMLGGKIAAGEPYAVYTPPRRVLRMPGFPLFLAGVRAVAGDSFLAARLALAGVGAAACAAVYLLGRTLVSKEIGLTAAALASLWPVLIGFSSLILSETLFALFLTLSLTTMAMLVRAVPSEGTLRRTMLVAALVGVTITLASYVRPTWLPAALFFPLAYWLWSGRTARAGLVAITVAVAAAATLAPWSIRNRLVTGHWVATTLWVGPSLYDGLHPGATGESDMRFFDEEQLSQTMSEYDVDREYRRRAWQFVVENPVRAVELAFVKLWRYWRPWPSAEQFSSPLSRLAVGAYYVPMMLLALRGAWVQRRDLWLVGLTAAPILLFAAVHCVFVASLRYRLPAEYPLCVLSAVGLHSLLSPFRSTEV